MNTKMTFPFFKRTRAFLAVTLVGAMAFSGVLMKNASTERARLGNISDGLLTCFTRVNQSYTAKMIGQNALAYLTSSFFAKSEECFGESISELKKLNIDSGLAIFKTFNELSIKTHDLHELMRDTNSKQEDVSLRFENLETLKETALEEVSELQSASEDFFSNSRIFFFICCALFPLLFIWEIKERRKFEKTLNDFEDEALRKIQDENLLSSSETSYFLKRVYENLNLSHCAQLFEKYASIKGQQKVLAKEVSTVVQPVKETSTFVVAEDNFISIKAKATDLGLVLAKVVDHLSTRIFTSGIILDLDVPENLNVDAKEEVLEQFLFYSILRSIQSLTLREGTRRLKISAKEISQKISLEFSDNGNIFSANELEEQVGLNTSTSNNIELSLCKSLANDLQASFSIENVFENGQAMGAKTKVFLQTALGAKKLVSLKKGKKKDLLETMI